MELIITFVAIVILFIAYYFIKRRLRPKVTWAISVIAFIALIVMFFVGEFIKRITTAEVIILSLCAAVYAYYLFYRYRQVKNT